MRRYRVAIVDPSIIIAEGVASILRAEAEVVAVCNSLAELAQRLRGIEVDAIVASVALARDIDDNTIAADIPVVGIQSSLMPMGGLGRFSAVATIYSSEAELQQMLRETVDAPAERNHAESHELSERERDVLVLVAKGFTNKEIASELNISPHTVISHRKNIVHKTGIRSVAGLTVYAVLNKLIDSEQL